MMDLATAVRTLAISLGLGLLVGLQRERVHAPLAGVRTFALITVLGTLTAMLAESLGPWVVVAGLLGIAAASVAGNKLSAQEPRPDPGITTEIAMLVMYVVGAYLVYGHVQVAVVVGGSVAVLLYAKPVLHRFVQRLGEADMRAIMQFVLISLVILPVLPDQRYGPLGAINPREIWWMVVLVVSISLAGYVALKLFGKNAGAILGGILGGVISSTATTVSYARRARSDALAAMAALVIVIATTVVYARVLFEIFIVARAVFPRIAPPIVTMLAVSLLTCGYMWWTQRRAAARTPCPENPTELKSALVFGAIYAVVLLAVAVARQQFGDRGIYAVAAISGLTDMDAITLTTSRLAVGDALPASTAWRAIVIATVSNLVFKAGIVAVLAGPGLFRRIAVLFGIQIAAGVAILMLWPR